MASEPGNNIVNLRGRVELGGQPMAGAQVTLWATTGAEVPRWYVRGSSANDGSFSFANVQVPQNSVVYLVARNEAKKLAMLSVLGTNPPGNVVVNEMTTVASAFTSARFINGESISGNPLGLRIAAGNAPNLVDPATGKWGKVLLDANNSTENTTLTRLNTLSSMITAFATVADDAWRAEFLNAATATGGATPKDTLEAMSGIARTPWANPKKLYDLFDKAYPQPKDGSRRSAPLVPYLAYAPTDFAMILKFSGGGVYSAGKLQVDAKGNIWSGQNWMAGSQSGVVHGIGGGTVKLAPDGTALSPPISGFTGMGVDGIGWGTGVSLDAAWVGGLNGKIGVMDFNGRPIGKESDFPMAGKVGNLMGVGVAADGDVWIADGTKDSLLHFPGGRVKDGKTVTVKGLVSPFGIAIDAQNRVWVSNSASDTVVRFPADDPSKAESFRAGISARGVALDSKGNLWVASNMSLTFPPPKLPKGISIMKQFQLVLAYVEPKLAGGKSTGVLNMIRPDGTQPAAMGFDGGGKVNVPWGVSIDGNDDVWFGNFWGRGVGLMAGAEPKGRAEGAKTGDLIHVFQSGSIQMVTDAVVDPAGNVWVANNWNVMDALDNPDPARPTSTKGGGDGIVVIYGVAAPVKTPVMGQMRQP
jgi:hypothetical protein